MRVLLVLMFLVSLIAEHKKAGEINFRLGDLYLKNKDFTQWNSEVDEGDPVFIKDTLKTGIESKCEIKLVDGSVLRMGESTIYTILEFQDGDLIKCEGELIEGKIWSSVNKDDIKREFNTRTPVAVAAVIGTIYRTSYSKDEGASVTVLEGVVNMAAVKKESISNPEVIQGPTPIDGPKEVSMEEWTKITAGQICKFDNNGNMKLEEVDIESLEKEWKSFR
ncbi:MAG: FecR domain-containing protein [Candidatus Delongbacteria bacterium]|nr:FecR domain-containing protein [Candidatus Delongbacteria bacterium]MBN2834837.1 FecR domain-containing protein [Candidatus Delongbacteria bacterium]